MLIIAFSMFFYTFEVGEKKINSHVQDLQQLRLGKPLLVNLEHSDGILSSLSQRCDRFYYSFNLDWDILAFPAKFTLLFSQVVFSCFLIQILRSLISQSIHKEAIDSNYPFMSKVIKKSQPSLFLTFIILYYKEANLRLHLHAPLAKCGWYDTVWSMINPMEPLHNLDLFASEN